MTRRLRGILGVGALSLLAAAARWGGLAATVLALAGATIGRVPSASR